MIEPVIVAVPEGSARIRLREVSPREVEPPVKFIISDGGLDEVTSDAILGDSHDEGASE